MSGPVVQGQGSGTEHQDQDRHSPVRRTLTDADDPDVTRRQCQRAQQIIADRVVISSQMGSRMCVGQRVAAPPVLQAAARQIRDPASRGLFGKNDPLCRNNGDEIPKYGRQLFCLKNIFSMLWCRRWNSASPVVWFGIRRRPPVVRGDLAAGRSPAGLTRALARD